MSQNERSIRTNLKAMFLSKNILYLSMNGMDAATVIVEKLKDGQSYDSWDTIHGGAKHYSTALRALREAGVVSYDSEDSRLVRLTPDALKNITKSGI